MTGAPPGSIEDDRASKLYGPPRAARRRPGASPDGLVSFASVRPVPPRWLWEGWLPEGALVILEGDPGAGKSTVALDMAARVSAGHRWPDGARCRAGAVIVLSAEDSKPTIAARLRAAGADMESVFTQSADDEQLFLPGNIESLGRMIRTRKARLVIIDVLVAFLDPQKINAYSDQDVRSALRPLAALGRSTSACILAIRHLNKTTGPSAIYRGGGSIGISGQARAVLLAALDPECPGLGVLAPVKSNLGKLPGALMYRLEDVPDLKVARVDWLGAGSYTADGLLAGPADEGRTASSLLADCTKWLDSYMTECNGRARSRDVIAAGNEAGFTRTVIQSAKDKLGIIAEKERGVRNGKWFWYLPGPGVDSEDSGSAEPESSGSSEPAEAAPAEAERDAGGAEPAPDSIPASAPEYACGAVPGQTPEHASG